MRYWSIALVGGGGLVWLFAMPMRLLEGTDLHYFFSLVWECGPVPFLILFSGGVVASASLYSVVRRVAVSAISFRFVGLLVFAPIVIGLLAYGYLEWRAPSTEQILRDLSTSLDAGTLTEYKSKMARVTQAGKAVDLVTLGLFCTMGGGAFFFLSCGVQWGYFSWMLKGWGFSLVVGLAVGILGGYTALSQQGFGVILSVAIFFFLVAFSLYASKSSRRPNEIWRGLVIASVLPFLWGVSGWMAQHSMLKMTDLTNKLVPEYAIEMGPSWVRAQYTPLLFGVVSMVLALGVVVGARKMSASSGAVKFMNERRQGLNILIGIILLMIVLIIGVKIVDWTATTTALVDESPLRNRGSTLYKSIFAADLGLAERSAWAHPGEFKTSDAYFEFLVEQGVVEADSDDLFWRKQPLWYAVEWPPGAPREYPHPV